MNDRTNSTKQTDSKRLSVISVTATVLFLSACSQTSEMGRLKHDYKDYSHSKYVNESLKAHPVNTVFPQTSSGGGNRNSTNQAVKGRDLKKVQRQVANKKSQSTRQISSTIQRNDLFIPPRNLQQQVAGLNRQQGYENWLKKHSSLSAVLTIALKNNLDIQSRLQATHASLAKYDQVSFLDDTLAQYAAFTKDLAVPVGNNKHNKPVSTGFPFPGLLGLKASIIDQAVESSRLQLKQTVQNIITQTRIAYYEWQLAHEEITIISRNIKLMKALKDQLKDSYSTSSINLGNILQVDIEIEKSRNTRQITRSTLAEKQARLNALLNLSASFSLGKPDKLRAVKLTQSATSLLQKGKQHRIEIARLRSDLKKMERVIQLSEKRFYPDFSAGYSRFQNQTTAQTGSNASKPAFSTRPNIGKRNFFGTNDAYLNETKLKYKALQAKLRALQKQTEDDITQTLSRYQIQKGNRVLYQSRLIPTAKTSLDIAKNLFETGDASYLKVTEIEKMILGYRLQSLKAIKDMNVNAAKLARVTGQSIGN